MLSAILPLALSGAFLTVSAPASALIVNYKPILSLDPYTVHLGDGSGCGSDNLTAWGWNFANGENLAVKFYVDGTEIGQPIYTTANRLGFTGGFFSAHISTYLGGYNDYTATVTEPDGLTWPASENIVC
jgi:hypothetical protein